MSDTRRRAQELSEQPLVRIEKAAMDNLDKFQPHERSLAIDFIRSLQAREIQVALLTFAAERVEAAMRIKPPSAIIIPIQGRA